MELPDFARSLPMQSVLEPPSLTSSRSVPPLDRFQPETLLTAFKIAWFSAHSVPYPAFDRSGDRNPGFAIDIP